MFVVIQFPIADTRDFLDVDTYRLSLPSFPLMNPNEQDFIRCFGPIKNRINQDGVEYYETVYSKANRALRIPNLGEYRLGREYGGFIPTCVFRRFFANNETCKLEIGFRNIQRSKFMQLPFTDMQLLNFLTELMEIKAQIPSKSRDNTEYKLNDVCTKLSSLYLYSTTKYPLPSDKQVQPSWIQAGNPMILMEYDKSEIVKLPHMVKHIASLEQFGISLAHTIIYNSRNKTKIRVWLIGKDKNSEKEAVRNLRLNLLRLNAEQECLKQVLRSIQYEKIIIKPHSEATDRLQNYINNAIRSIRQNERYGIPNSEIIEVSNSYENIINGNERTFLLTQLESIRKNIYRKVKLYTEPTQKPSSRIIVSNSNGGSNIYIEGTIQEGGIVMTNTNVTIGDNNTFTGNNNIGSVLIGSSNTITNMEPKSKDEELLKQKLAELNELVTELCKNLSAEEGEQAAKDMAGIVQEATSSKPRKSYLELFTGGILAASKYCSSLIEPIAKAVDNLMGLIGKFIK